MLLSFFSPVRVQSPKKVEVSKRNVYLTDLERDLTFAGTIESYEEIKGTIKVSLRNVQVFDYSSSTPLYYLPAISLSRPKNLIYIEDFQ